MVRRIGFWPRTAVALLKPILFVVTKRDWQGMDRIPRTGGVIIAANHMSEFDPLVIAHFVYDAGRWPQYLAKSSLFKVPVLGPIIKAVRQIPVERGTIDASRALDAAIAAIRRGEDVIIYPEGTTPKKGDLWPQRGKTGIARLFLATGAPVIPVATWGAQQVFDPRERKLHLRPRRPVTVIAGNEIDLSKWKGVEPTAANLYAITDEIMLVLRRMVGEIRGETPPLAPSSAGRRLANGTADVVPVERDVPGQAASSEPADGSASSEPADGGVVSDGDAAAPRADAP
ncbi:MAG TPA: lysophospholipid acyltransferase family protein [Micromonosporaceae bacterium]|nr:lysophospholipid acyltransferase family protein [Micromonosporaceae bacterium]